MATISSPGVGSGLNINSLIAQIIASESQPTSSRLDAEQSQTQTEISALGSLKSALSTFQAALAKLDSPSDFQLRSATSGDTSLFTVSADSHAVAGSYDVSVEQLATSQKLASPGVATPDTVVGTGTLTITVGSNAFQVSVDSGANTLADIRDAINGAAGNTGVSATIVTVDNGFGGNESQLVLTATGTGTANAITVSVDDSDGNSTDQTGLSLLAYDPAGSGATNLTELTPAHDAQIKVDGQTATRSSNVLNDVIDGVTINLVAANPGNATTLSVADDKGSLTTALNGFVSSYNALIKTLDKLSQFDPTGANNGPLLGDSTVRNIENILRRGVGSTVSDPSSPFSSLSEIGIGFGVDGTLSLDSTRLSAATDKSFDGIGQLFAAADGGVATGLEAALQPFVESSGIIDSRTTGLNSELDSISQQRDDLNRRMSLLQTSLLQQYTAMDQIVSQLQSTGSFLSGQLTSLQNIGGGSTTG